MKEPNSKDIEIWNKEIDLKKRRKKQLKELKKLKAKMEKDPDVMYAQKSFTK